MSDELLVNPQAIMELKQLQANWNEFGNQDPLWAILSAPEKRDGKWDLAEFFGTGREEVERVLDYLASLGVAVKRGNALDFGCGVGRLTQALALHFESCVGIDIAPSMIALARRYNQIGDRCQYLLNGSDDLAIVGGHRFDFIYSNIVLQHMAPQYSKRYVREFIRVLAPGGIAVFQVPSGLSALPDSGLSGVPPEGAAIGPSLPDAAFRARLLVQDSPVAAAAGSRLTLAVTVQNLGTVRWPGPASNLRHPVRLGNRWLDREGRPVVPDDGRANLTADLPPSEKTELFLVVNTPSSPGEYVLELDMVQELIAWFKDKGSAPLALPIVVTTRVTLVDKQRAANDGDTNGPTPDMTAPVGAAVLVPKMEMHGVPRDQVIELISHSDATLLDVREDHFAGASWQSLRYCVLKNG